MINKYEFKENDLVRYKLNGYLDTVGLILKTNELLASVRIIMCEDASRIGGINIKLKSDLILLNEA
jgi:hypothetical protein